MSEHDPRVDAYIAAAAEFARPILVHLREVVHSACPGVVEAIKWGHPHFLHGNELLCHFAAFKQHVALGFWKGALLDDVGATSARSDAMGQFGRLSSVDDLPSKRVLAGLIRKAMALNEKGIKRPAAPRKPAGESVRVPPELVAALNGNRQAKAQFEKFPPGQQCEYSEWIADAKRSETRIRRVAQAIEWIAEGKLRNWKYMSKKPTAKRKT